MSESKAKKAAGILNTNVVNNKVVGEIKSKEVLSAEEERTAEIQAKREDLIRQREEFESTSFLLDGGLEYCQSLIDWVENHAKFSAEEAMGIVQLRTELLEQLEKIESGEQKDAFLRMLAIEAAHYFLKKVESKGYEAAQKFVDLYKPIGVAIQKMNKIFENLKTLEFQLVSLESGLDVEELQSIVEESTPAEQE